jgi:hypothetical protein
MEGPVVVALYGAVDTKIAVDRLQLRSSLDAPNDLTNPANRAERRPKAGGQYDR